MAGEPDTASAQLGLEAAKHGSGQLPTAAPNRRRADPARYPPARRKRHLPRSVPRNGGAAGHGTGRRTTKLAGTHRDRSLPPLPASARGCADGWTDGRRSSVRDEGDSPCPSGFWLLLGGRSPRTAACSLPSWRDRGASTQDQDIWVLFLALLLAIHHISPFPHLLSGNNAVLLKLST